MQRRDFIKKTTSAIALAATTGGVGWVFHNREPAAYETPLAASLSFGVADDPRLPRLTLAHNENPASALNAALDAIGGIRRFVRPGERVVIKPNVGWDRTAAQAANTNPDLVGQVVRLCLDAGAREVVVTDVTCNDPRRCFLRSGISEAAEAAGGLVRLPTDEDYETVDLGGELLTGWPVLKHFLHADRMINMPVVKHHSLTGGTIGLKNLYGIIGGHRNQLHQQIDQSIVDLANFCRPTLTIVDATRVLLRGGPQGGSLDDVEIKNTVMCATDPVAADSRAAEFLGRQGDTIGHVVLAQRAGLGNLDYRQAGYQEVG
ncbi:MAG: DUF362 domain-containing protein [bacterium]